MCPIQHSSCSLFGLCRFFSFIIHFKDTVYFCITNTNLVLCLVTTWFPQTNQLRITGLRYPANVIYGGKSWFCSPFDCRHQLQVCGVIRRNSCREESHVQVLSRWFPQHLEPPVSLRSRWPLLCRRESLELSVCLLCGFIFLWQAEACALVQTAIQTNWLLQNAKESYQTRTALLQPGFINAMHDSRSCFHYKSDT